MIRTEVYYERHTGFYVAIKNIPNVDKVQCIYSDGSVERVDNILLVNDYSFVGYLEAKSMSEVLKALRDFEDRDDKVCSENINNFDSADNYQMLASRTMNHNLTKQQQEYHALHGMVGEIGELHSIYQKFYQGHIEDGDEHRRKELGDLLWFIAEYCTACGWNLSEIMQMNIDKLIARYPEGFEQDKSLHRQEGDI